MNFPKTTAHAGSKDVLPPTPRLALPPHYAQVSTWAPQPSQPPTPYGPDELGELLLLPLLQLQSLLLLPLPPISLCLGLLSARVSPYHQRGSMTPLAAPLAPLAQACPPDPPGPSNGWMAPSPKSFGASTPSTSPRCSVPFRSMGGDYTPTACPTILSEGAPQSGCLTSLARSSHWPKPADIAKWVARASTDEVLDIWDATARTREQTLCWEQTPGPPHSSHLSPMMRLLANDWSQARRAQWVHTHLAMFASPSHPYHHLGGSTGLMAPSPVVQQGSTPLMSMAHPPMPAHLTKTAPQQCMQSFSSPSHPHQHMGGSPGLMAPSPTIQQVSRPLPSKVRPSMPACLTKTAPQQRMQSLSSPFPKF
jgi:hypothetical protein